MAALAVSLAPGSASVQPGAQRFERERVNEIQRSRILAAAGQVCCERGAANMTVGLIVERAGVSRRTFYELYHDSEECLLAAFADAFERARKRVLHAWSAEQGSSRERTRSSLAALLGLFDEDSVLAGLLVVESLAAGHRVLADRARVLGDVTEALRGLAPDGGKGSVFSNGTEPAARLSMEGALGGVLSVLHARISQRSPGRLIELTSPLMSMLVLPLEGPALARREAQRPAPDAPHSLQGEPQAPVLRSDPFKDAGTRLTYRTMRVLCAIQEQPGSSNRKIGDLAEVGDQGQVSKLLARLERVGVIVNTAAGASKGEANAWTLTPAGRQVTDRINAQTQQSDVLDLNR
jgi:AcrR family transcriptional regulator/DNA-binding MarR family transcriptional regulator